MRIKEDQFVLTAITSSPSAAAACLLQASIRSIYFDTWQQLRALNLTREAVLTPYMVAVLLSLRPRCRAGLFLTRMKPRIDTAQLSNCWTMQCSGPATTTNGWSFH